MGEVIGMVTGESIKQRKAFEFYYALDHGRTYRQVAEEVKVNIRTVQTWAKNYTWKARVQQRDIDVGNQLDKKMIESVSDIKAALVDSLYEIYEKTVMAKLANGDIPFEIKNAKDFEIIIKNMMLLIGEATERKDNAPDVVSQMSEADREKLLSAIGLISSGGDDGNGVEEHDDFGDEEPGPATDK